jgi:hypothetical protein
MRAVRWCGRALAAEVRLAAEPPRDQAPSARAQQRAVAAAAVLRALHSFRERHAAASVLRGEGGRARARGARRRLRRRRRAAGVGGPPARDDVRPSRPQPPRGVARSKTRQDPHARVRGGAGALPATDAILARAGAPALYLRQVGLRKRMGRGRAVVSWCPPLRTGVHLYTVWCLSYGASAGRPPRRPPAAGTTTWSGCRSWRTPNPPPPAPLPARGPPLAEQARVAGAGGLDADGGAAAALAARGRPPGSAAGPRRVRVIATRSAVARRGQGCHEFRGSLQDSNRGFQLCVGSAG